MARVEREQVGLRAGQVVPALGEHAAKLQATVGHGEQARSARAALDDPAVEFTLYMSYGRSLSRSWPPTVPVPQRAVSRGDGLMLTIEAPFGTTPALRGASSVPAGGGPVHQQERGIDVERGEDQLCTTGHLHLRAAGIVVAARGRLVDQIVVIEVRRTARRAVLAVSR
jgi:hypothetical protein